jgi:hypothetical protein
LANIYPKPIIYKPSKFYEATRKYNEDLNEIDAQSQLASNQKRKDFESKRLNLPPQRTRLL